MPRAVTAPTSSAWRIRAAATQTSAGRRSASPKSTPSAARATPASAARRGERCGPARCWCRPVVLIGEAPRLRGERGTGEVRGSRLGRVRLPGAAVTQPRTGRFPAARRRSSRSATDQKVSSASRRFGSRWSCGVPPPLGNSRPGTFYGGRRIRRRGKYRRKKPRSIAAMRSACRCAWAPIRKSGTRCSRTSCRRPLDDAHPRRRRYDPRQPEARVGVERPEPGRVSRVLCLRVGDRAATLTSAAGISNSTGSVSVNGTRTLRSRRPSPASGPRSSITVATMSRPPNLRVTREPTGGTTSRILGAITQSLPASAPCHQGDLPTIVVRWALTARSKDRAKARHVERQTRTVRRCRVGLPSTLAQS